MKQKNEGGKKAILRGYEGVVGGGETRRNRRVLKQMTGEVKGKNSGEKRTFEKTRVFSKSKCGQKKVIFKKKKERKEMVREKKKESRSLITKDGIVGCLTLG